MGPNTKHMFREIERLVGACIKLHCVLTSLHIMSMHAQGLAHRIVVTQTLILSLSDELCLRHVVGPQ